MPTATGNPVTVKMHAPIEWCIVTYALACRETWPTVPHPQSVVNEGMVLLESHEETVFPQFNGKQRDYITLGYYVFLNKYPTGPASDLSSGVQDGDNLPLQQSILRAANYKMGILSSKYLDKEDPALKRFIDLQSGVQASKPIVFQSGVIFPSPSLGQEP